MYIQICECDIFEPSPQCIISLLYQSLGYLFLGVEVASGNAKLAKHTRRASEFNC